LALRPGLRGQIVLVGGFYVNYEGTELMIFRQRKVLAICSIAFSVAATSAFADISENQKSEPAVVQTSAKVVNSKRKARVVRAPATVAYAAAPASSSSLVAEARRYLGTNPTSRRSLWCGAFMDMVLQKTGHKPGGNLASSYASYGRRVAGPQVGALAVMSRGRGGGHVGVVSGVDASGSVIVVSGNHNNTVAESVYPRSRIYAYVMPEG
jgi:uncharacterized protein (TIGR02594 family)